MNVQIPIPLRAGQVLPQQTGLDYGVAWREATSGRTVEVCSPSSGQALCSIADAAPTQPLMLRQGTPDGSLQKTRRCVQPKVSRFFAHLVC